MKRLLFFSLMLLFVGIQVALAQTGSIRGRVVNDNGEPVSGAVVSVKGSSTAVVTDDDGYFVISANSGDALTITGVGVKKTEISAQDGVVAKVTFTKKEMKEAVVTAVGIKKEKRSLGYASTTITSDNLNSANNVSALSALQGKTAGVNITSTTGGPGGSTRVVLRGEKSFGGNNNALIVVDGIPINNGNRIQSNSLTQIDFGNRGNDINPDDIENITVLKGPAAAALYGAAGANGAIMITTKGGRSKGKVGKNEMNFSTSMTLSSVLKYPEFQNQFGQGDLNGLPDDRRENFSWGLPFDGQIRPWGQEIDGKQKVKPYSAIPNNVRDFFRIGKTWENALSLGGGSESTTYFMSLNTLNNTGIMPNTFLNRYSIRLNATHDFTNKFYSSINLNYINGTSRVEQSGQQDGGLWNNLLQTPRDIPIAELADLNDPFNSYYNIDADGNQRSGYYGEYTNNPYWISKYYDNRNKYDRIIAQNTIGYRINNKWEILNRLGGEVTADRTFIKTPKISATPYDPLYSSPKQNNGGYSEQVANINNIFNDLMLKYNTEISEDLSFNGILGHNITSFSSTSLSSTIDPVTNGLVVADFYNFDNASSAIEVANSLNRSRLIGIYGSANFAYKKQLYLELTGRNDWTSTLIPEKRSLFYPSVNASWVITEALGDNVRKTLNYAKIRANYASVGNSAAAYANNAAGYVKGDFTGGFGSTIFPFNGVPGFTETNIYGLRDLDFERTNSYEVGVDLSFFKDRLMFNTTLYKSISKNQIITQPLPPSSGYLGQILNSGTMENKGIEFELRALPIVRKGLKWELFGTFTRNRNTVIDIHPSAKNIILGGFTGMNIVATPGMPYGTFYSVDFLRDPQGRVVIDTLTGQPKSTALPQYLQYNFQPKFIASWGTTLNYKNFAFNVLFDTKQGSYIYTRTKDIMEFVGTSTSTLLGDRQPIVWENSVYESGTDASGNTIYTPNTTYKTDAYHYYTTANVKPNSADIVNGSYVKLRETSLSYKVPAKLFSKTPFGGATLGVYGSNLFIWTHSENKYVDPEVNSGGASNEQGFDYSARPSLRNYGVRLNVSF